MKIGIIGIGVVGSAVYKSLQLKLSELDNIVPYDKYKNIGSFEYVLNTEIVFLCLPTLYDDKINEYDMTSTFEVCSKLSDNNYNGIVVIKSTVTPTSSQNIADKYNLNIIHNPEFLSADTAFEDFHNQSHIIIGKTNKIKDLQINILSDFFKTYYNNAHISYCTSTESESIKIFCNCFYAAKLQFFNELYLLCNKLGTNYNNIRDIMLLNNWINPMHTNVPGKNGVLSYGGMCFPKDTEALLSFMKKIDTRHKVLEAVVEERNEMRSD